ncbi:hypothetical protein [Nocardia sp. NBC_01327]|uniref:hypothetical protein n=1 Tax=Nocardia sp. NBC_01327 TaxID=2903593 RepID=UPI002E15DBEB|nr:hypothetical protein OG326_15850 [Nocardia sp. NBC_01327]
MILDDPSILVGTGEEFSVFVMALLKGWQRQKADYLSSRNKDERPVQWYEEPKLAAGEFATFLAVRLDPSYIMPHSTDSERVFDTVVWQSAALGDSCLFQIREGRIIKQTPISNASEFSHKTALLGSRTENSALVYKRTHFDSGTAEAGDDFFLMTDAMANWLLTLQDSSDSEEFERTVANLIALTSSGNLTLFRSWIEENRASTDLRNDDIALVHISLSR